MRRREFISLLGGSAVAWPLAGWAQQSRNMARIVFFAGGSKPASIENSVYNAFLQGLREVGYVDGKNVSVAWRFAEGQNERFAEIAAEVTALHPDVIVLGTSAAAQIMQKATSAIPIVLANSVDPVGDGYVASLARPGGNITGLASSVEVTVAKQLELLAASVTNFRRVGVLTNRKNDSSTREMNLAMAAEAAHLLSTTVRAGTIEGVRAAFATFRGDDVQGVIVLPDAFYFANQRVLADVANQANLPTVFSQREYVESGGLISYGQGLADFFRQSATYVDKILKGAKPADLPIEQPTRFYLVINLKTAKALGLSIPPTLLARADEVIE